MDQWETGISILESVSNLEGKIDKEAVRETVGLPSMEKMIDILGAVIEGDINKTLKISNELMDEGKEPESYITELLKLLESIYLKDKELIGLYTEHERKMLEKYMNIDKFRIYKIIKEVLNIIMLMKNMENKRIMLIAALMNLAGNNNLVMEKDRKVLEGKNKSIHNIEQNIDKVISNNSKISVNVEKHKNENKVIEESSIEKNDILSQNKTLDKKEKLDMLAIRKYMLVNKEMKLFVLLNNIEIYVKENNAYLVSKMELNEDILTKESLKIIKDAIRDTTGKEYIVEYVKEK